MIIFKLSRIPWYYRGTFKRNQTNKQYYHGRCHFFKKKLSLYMCYILSNIQTVSKQESKYIFKIPEPTLKIPWDSKEGKKPW